MLNERLHLLDNHFVQAMADGIPRSAGGGDTWSTSAAHTACSEPGAQATSAADNYMLGRPGFSAANQLPDPEARGGQRVPRRGPHASDGQPNRHLAARPGVARRQRPR